MGRIAQGTKVLAEGGHDRIFRRAFSAPPDEQLRKSYTCYLSTAAGPVVGVLYLSTARVAFCSDGPLSYEAGGGGGGGGDGDGDVGTKPKRRPATWDYYFFELSSRWIDPGQVRRSAALDSDARPSR